MADCLSLWLPMLLSAVFVFIASSIIHMLLPWHKGDFKTLPDEGRVMDALRPFNIPPGDYMMPRPKSMDDMKSAEFKEKNAKGPVAVMTVLPTGRLGMGSELIQWFVYVLVVSLLVGCLLQRALPPGTEYLRVFKYATFAGFLAYSMGLWPQTIWYKKSVGTTLRSSIDGLLYAMLTAGTFGWLWPK